MNEKDRRIIELPDTPAAQVFLSLFWAEVERQAREGEQRSRATADDGDTNHTA